jgi:hypothetical protein
MIVRKSIYLIVVAFLLVGLASCMHKEGSLKPVSEMTPKEKATFFMSVYNSQAEDYKAMVAKPNLTNEQKQVLREKKKVLTQVYPLIQSYTTYVDAGAVPTPEVEASITNLINELTSTALMQLQ